MRKHLSLMLLLLLLITCTACGQRQTVQRMAADRITQAESVAQLQEVSDLIVVFTPERQENMALTNKYLNNKIVLMALADSDIDVTSAKELADLKIGTQVDSSALQMLMANEAYESFKDNISEYETYDTAIMDLIGEALSSGAYLTSLRRTRSGTHDVEAAWQLDDFLKKLRGE